MRDNLSWMFAGFSGILLATLLVCGIWNLSKEQPRKEYAFLKAEVMYGNLPPNTAKVSKCFERFVGYRAVFCGKVYFITGTTGHNPFHPEHIYFSGNANIKIYDKRLIPIFRSGTIEDKVEENFGMVEKEIK